MTLRQLSRPRDGFRHRLVDVGEVIECATCRHPFDWHSDRAMAACVMRAGVSDYMNKRCWCPGWKEPS